MEQPVEIPPGLAAMLEAEGARWNDVWKPLNRAIKQGQPCEIGLNLTGYSFSPETDRIVVGGLLESDGEVSLEPSEFLSAMKQFLRGAPEC